MLAKTLASSPVKVVALQGQIALARFAYLRQVHATAENFRSGRLTRDQARAEIMGEVCAFAKASGLTQRLQSSRLRPRPRAGSRRCLTVPPSQMKRSAFHLGRWHSRSVTDLLARDDVPSILNVLLEVFTFANWPLPAEAIC